MSLNFALFDFLFPSFLDGSDSKVYSCNSGDPGLIPGSERSPAEGNGNPLQYSCLDNSMDRGAWQATLMGLQRVRHHWTTNTTPTSLFINWNSTIKKAERQRTDAFELWCWGRLLRVPWTVRRSNQSILKEISPGCSLEGLMLKLKLQYFGYLIWKDS